MLTDVNGFLSTTVTSPLRILERMAAGFAQRLKEAAAEAEGGRGVIPAWIAAQLKVERAAVSFWLSGRSEPKGRNLSALSELLGVRSQWLATGEGPKRENGHSPPVDPRTRRVVELARTLTDDALELWERNARDYLSLQGVRSTADDQLSDEAGVAMADIRREGLELLRAWQKLPENERDEFKRRVEVAAMKYSRRVNDERLDHLAAPGTKAASRAGKAARKAPAKAKARTPGTQ